MLDAKDITRKVEAVKALLHAKFGIKQRPLSRMILKAGRRLPRRVQKQAQVLVEAERFGAHPKLARQMDGARVSQAYNVCVTYLDGIDVADRRKGRILGIAGAIVFNLLVVVAVFVLWLWWHDYV
ncbi:hypothetical protein Z946_851 [Sulfitobacter noctilucicola]|uniref:Uncharacterized protein n=1 Tax=Sulfitobacter noctilucicola TaxID=1342301 RepID=A0A7W6Q3V1_9RHOB|nr:hypothetical protein [Sulfitobacter noctilucicola]KIN61995.1 hypothetical protein Z946_851 [Sulfitobacter noctilucicola]MBB4173484.1 hypothetical protein [Sulfitobacter noctilucicola]